MSRNVLRLSLGAAACSSPEFAARQTHADILTGVPICYKPQLLPLQYLPSCIAGRQTDLLFIPL
jgi:hypothetical protein